MIHPKSVEVQENKEVVYDIVKSKKGFFARLADASASSMPTPYR